MEKIQADAKAVYEAVKQMNIPELNDLFYPSSYSDMALDKHLDASIDRDQPPRAKTLVAPSSDDAAKYALRTINKIIYQGSSLESDGQEYKMGGAPSHTIDAEDIFHLLAYAGGECRNSKRLQPVVDFVNQHSAELAKTLQNAFEYGGHLGSGMHKMDTPSEVVVAKAAANFIADRQIYKGGEAAKHLAQKFKDDDQRHYYISKAVTDLCEHEPFLSTLKGKIDFPLPGKNLATQMIEFLAPHMETIVAQAQSHIPGQSSARVGRG